MREHSLLLEREILIGVGLQDLSRFWEKRANRGVNFLNSLIEDDRCAVSKLTAAVESITSQQSCNDHGEWQPLFLRNGDANQEKRRGDVHASHILRGECGRRLDGMRCGHDC